MTGRALTFRRTTLLRGQGSRSTARGRAVKRSAACSEGRYKAPAPIPLNAAPSSKPALTDARPTEGSFTPTCSVWWGNGVARVRLPRSSVSSNAGRGRSTHLLNVNRVNSELIVPIFDLSIQRRCTLHAFFQRLNSSVGINLPPRSGTDCVSCPPHCITRLNPPDGESGTRGGAATTDATVSSPPHLFRAISEGDHASCVINAGENITISNLWHDWQYPI